jgi:hypothetical protein
MNQSGGLTAVPLRDCSDISLEPVPRMCAPAEHSYPLLSELRVVPNGQSHSGM